MNHPHLVRTVFATWLPSSVTAAEVTAVLTERLGAARVAVYPEPTLYRTPPRCAPHEENATAYDAWYCPRCLAEGAGPR